MRHYIGSGHIPIEHMPTETVSFGYRFASEALFHGVIPAQVSKIAPPGSPADHLIV
jgi:hypothetical protein